MEKPFYSEAAPPPFPERLFKAGFAVMIALIALSSMLTWQAGNQIRAVVNSQSKVLTSAERVANYGNVLELTIKHVVADGDTEAAARYKKVQPQLRDTLTRLRNEIGHKPNKVAAEEVNKADLALIDMEYRALALAERGQLVEARKVIRNPEYERLIAIYSDGVKVIEQRANGYVVSTQMRLDRYLNAIMALSVASFGLLLVGWFTIARPMRRWGTELKFAHREVSDAAQALEEGRLQLEVLNRKLFEQARVDPLTKVYTRRKFNEDVEDVWHRVGRYEESYCAVLCDIDNFKQYNDTYGHLDGDEALRQVANALTGSCRNGDEIYRFGGEEFVLILSHSSLETGIAAAERCRRAVEKLAIRHTGSPLGLVTVSMGVAFRDSIEEWTVERWLREADEALYEAKRTGRNRVAAFNVLAPKTQLC